MTTKTSARAEAKTVRIYSGIISEKIHPNGYIPNKNTHECVCWKVFPFIVHENSVTISIKNKASNVDVDLAKQ